MSEKAVNIPMVNCMKTKGDRYNTYSVIGQGTLLGVPVLKMSDNDPSDGVST